MGVRVGEMPCLNPKCSCQDMAVEKTAANTLQAKCHKCQCPTFGKLGTPWRREMEKLIVYDKDETPAPAAPSPSVPAPRGGFNLGNL